MAEPQNAELREAISELQLYFSDTLPPLVVADSIGLLLKYPPELAAQQIQGWLGSQYRSGGDIPISDYLFHAVRKIHAMGEFNLVPREELIQYLETLKLQVLAFCPEDDRELLRESFNRLGEPSGSVAGPSVDSLLRQRRPLASDSHGDVLNTRRMSILLDRLVRDIRPGGGALDANWKDRPATAQALAAAARTAQNANDIDRMVEQLRGLGLDVGTRDMFQTLGKNLP